MFGDDFTEYTGESLDIDTPDTGMSGEQAGAPEYLDASNVTLC